MVGEGPVGVGGASVGREAQVAVWVEGNEDVVIVGELIEGSPVGVEIGADGLIRFAIEDGATLIACRIGARPYDGRF